MRFTNAEWDVLYTENGQIIEAVKSIQGIAESRIKSEPVMAEKLLKITGGMLLQCQELALILSAGLREQEVVGYVDG